MQFISLHYQLIIFLQLLILENLRTQIDAASAERIKTSEKQQYTVQHIECISSLPFEQVVANFESSVGSVENGIMRQIIAKSKDQKDFERLVKAREGKSGLMTFLVIDHGAWLPLMGIQGKKARMYTIGNPLLAVTMLKYDLRAGLNVPVRLLIYENIDHSVRISYDLPSSLMSWQKNKDVTTAAKVLDDKLQNLCEYAAGGSNKNI